MALDPAFKKPNGILAKALREINREVSDFKLRGRKKYYSIYDARFVWRRDLGQCYDCGLYLDPIGGEKDSGYFTHRIPPKLGGKIEASNLIVVCVEHKKSRDKKKKLPSHRTTGYNALSDIIVHLIEAVINKDKEKIIFFKNHFDSELKDIVDCSYYPIETIKELERVPKSPLSSYVEDITKKLVKEIEIIGQTKTYELTRK